MVVLVKGCAVEGSNQILVLSSGGSVADRYSIDRCMFIPHPFLLQVDRSWCDTEPLRAEVQPLRVQWRVSLRSKQWYYSSVPGPEPTKFPIHDLMDTHEEESHTGISSIAAAPPTPHALDPPSSSITTLTHSPPWPQPFSPQDDPSDCGLGLRGGSGRHTVEHGL